MKKRAGRVKLVGDFETTVYDGQQFTEVWASGLCEIGVEEAKIFTSIEDTLSYIISNYKDVIIYYHNLKFDGQFWIDYLIRTLKMTPAYADDTACKWMDDKLISDNQYKVLISEMGVWYRLLFKYRGCTILLLDSYKLLPFSLRDIGKSFKTRHQKSIIEYTGYRKSGGTLTHEEEEYLKNDLYVISEALEIFFAEGHTKSTIGSNCLAEYKKLFKLYEPFMKYSDFFPNLFDWDKDKAHIIGEESTGKFIRKCYKGGWCYLKKGMENKILYNGCTYDCNSEYPSMMHSDSNNYYPVGYPIYWVGNYIPDEAERYDRIYYIKIKCRFKLRKGYLPTVQIKTSYLYSRNEWLESSVVTDKKGNVYDHTCTLYFSVVDFKLFKHHYYIYDLDIIGGCWFYAQKGYFDMYIDKYNKIKQMSEGALRTLAKLLLNNLYGKFAATINSSYKVPFLDYRKNIIRYEYVFEEDKIPGYIAAGAMITSYARNFTISAAQENYDNFVYADTDSIHCCCNKSEVKGIIVHPSNLLAWKCECEWDKAIFVRQKTYIEYDGNYNIKCAGMNQKCKDFLIRCFTDRNFTEDELPYAESIHYISDFKIGLKVPGKIVPKKFPGGIVLTETDYEMR